MKIQKIVDKEFDEVKGQGNCTVVGKPTTYVTGQDCKNDCNAYKKPRSYKNEHL